MAASIVNKRVIISGLQGRPDLNGKKGRVISYDENRERFYVQVDDNLGGNTRAQFENLLSLKEENLILESVLNNDNQSNQRRESSQSTTQGATTSIASLLGAILSASGKTFRQENWGLLSFFFTLLMVVGWSWMNSIATASSILLLCQLFIEMENKNIISRDQNLPNQFRLCLKSLEFNIGVFLTRRLHIPIEGYQALMALSGAALLANYYFRSMDFYDDYYDDGYFSGGLGTGAPFSIGGISILSLIFLGLIFYKLDIPNNGLGALRNLNFFEIMYLFNTLQSIFGGMNNRRSYRAPGYGYGSPYTRRGYGGYGRGGRFF